MISSTTNFGSVNAANNATMRSLSDAELDGVVGGQCDLTKEIKCPIGHLFVLSECPTGPVVLYSVT